MSKKYRQAAREKLRLQDRYIDGVAEDDDADEFLAWHDANAPEYEAIKSGHHIEDSTDQIPF